MNLPGYIEVETSRYCNRQCAWCPNHLLSERRAQELMDWPLFVAILRSLSRHQYEGWFAFHNYNEPLANPRIVREVAAARAEMACAKLTIFTNGDYLTPELFDGLVVAGLTQMRVTVYPKAFDCGTGSHARLWHWLDGRPFLRRQGWREVTLRQGPALVIEDPVAVELISPDVSRYYDRGGMLPVLSITRRSAPCFLTSHSLSIDYRGDIKMCCNVVTGHPPHELYLFGNVRECDPVETWNSPRFAEIRGRHRQSQWSETPICTTCRQEIPRS